MIYYCHVVIFNIALSIQNFKAAMAVPAVLGLDPTIANSGIIRNMLTGYGKEEVISKKK